MRDAVVGAGCVMIDNSSAFRMDEDVPLVVPEVNPDDVGRAQRRHRQPQLLDDPDGGGAQAAARTRAHQAGRGRRPTRRHRRRRRGDGGALRADREFLDDEELTVEQFAHRIAFNCIPHIDVFLDDGSTKEEWKMVVETKKIMHAPEIEVHATCVRVPVLRCHSEAVHVEFDAAGRRSKRLARALERAPGVTVLDDPEAPQYPMPAMLEGTDDTYVGRLRVDPTVESGIAMWVVADQLRKGAALNAVQIAELLLG